MSESQSEKEKLIALANSDTKYNMLIQTGDTVLDLLLQFPSINIPLGSFLELMPKLRYRYYSVSSSPIEHPDGARVTGNTMLILFCFHSNSPLVGLVEKKFNNSKVKAGLCSNFLTNLSVPRKAFIFISPPMNSTFTLPSNPSTPIIMICAGQQF